MDRLIPEWVYNLYVLRSRLCFLRAKLVLWVLRVALVRTCIGALGCSTCVRWLNLQDQVGCRAYPIATGILPMTEDNHISNIYVERATQGFASTHADIVVPCQGRSLPVETIEMFLKCWLAKLGHYKRYSRCTNLPVLGR